MTPPDQTVAKPSTPGWGRRVLWLVLIWAASVAALGIAATVMRRVMGLVGLTG